MKYLSLDEYGKRTIESILKSEFSRCQDQKTLYDTSDYSVNIKVKPDNISE